MEEKETEERILFARGDRATFERVVREYTHPVFRFLFRLVGNREEAEDLVQETFLKIWKTADRFDPVRSLRAWIFAIARNTAYDFLRTKKHVQFSDLSVPEGESIEETLRDDTYLPDALFAAQESGDTVLAALQKLSPEYRIVVMLHVYEALTFEEVAQVVDRPMNTVKSQYRRALGALRSELVKTMHQSDVHIRID